MVKQYLFIDESGDTGLITRPGSSKYFVLTGVLFSDQLSALVTSQQLDDLKAVLKLTKDYEFKYHKLKPVNKEKFFQFANNLDCRVFSLIMRKISKAGLVDLTLMVAKLVDCIVGEIGSDGLIFRLILDGKGSSTHTTKMRSAVRLGTKVKIESIRFSDSRKDSLIQLADMSAGLTHGAEQGKQLEKESLRYYKKIRRFYLN